MRTNYVLIDFENVQVKSLALLAEEHFRVYLFLGPNHTKLPTDLAIAMHELGDRATYVRLETPGPNALDFHIAYYLGTLNTADPAGFFHVISKDTGFDPLIQHLKARKIFAARSASMDEMPCFRPAGYAQETLPASAPTPPSSAGKNGIEALVSLALDDLIKRKAAKPRKLATSKSTVRARLGQDGAGHLDDVIHALVSAGHLAISDDKVSYHLPSP